MLAAMESCIGDRQRPGRRRFQKTGKWILHGGYEIKYVQLLRLRAFEHAFPAAVVFAH